MWATPTQGGHIVGNNLWIGAWLVPDNKQSEDSGYVTESHSVTVDKLEKCDGTSMANSFTGTDGVGTVTTGYGPNYSAPNIRKKGVNDIYTVFANTEVGASGENLKDCSVGKLTITWTVQHVWGVDPKEGMEGSRGPLSEDERDQSVSNYANEWNHKWHNPVGGIDEGDNTKTYTMKVWWDFCKGDKTVHKTPEWGSKPRK